MLRSNEHELSMSYASRTSGTYSRYETPAELLTPTQLAKSAIANIEALVKRGLSYDEIADLVETRTNHPSAVVALGFIIMQHRLTGGEILRKSRKLIVTCSFTHAVVERLALRCDIIWSKL
jgi:hypothetical protein